MAPKKSLDENPIIAIPEAGLSKKHTPNQTPRKNEDLKNENDFSKT